MNQSNECIKKQPDQELVVQYDVQFTFTSYAGFKAKCMKKVSIYVVGNSWYLRKLDDELKDVITQEITEESVRKIFKKLEHADLLDKYFK